MVMLIRINVKLILTAYGYFGESLWRIWLRLHGISVRIIKRTTLMKLKLLNAQVLQTRLYAKPIKIAGTFSIKNL